jgi:hypothetical protein
MAPATAQESHDHHAMSPSASLSVTLSDGLLNVHAAGVQCGRVLDGIARHAGIRIRADGPGLTELLTTSFQNVPVDTAIRRLVPPRIDLILIYTAASRADQEGRLSETWLLPRRTAGDGIAAGEHDKAGPPERPSEPLLTDDPSTALTLLLAQLAAPDPRIRAAAVNALGEDAQAADTLGQVLVEADGREAAASALAWLIDRSK